MSKTSSSFLAFLMGIGTGVALGILYAPDKGENTRDRLSYRLGRYREQLQNLIDDLVSQADQPESMARAESKKVVDDAREKAERLLSDVEALMGQIKLK